MPPVFVMQAVCAHVSFMPSMAVESFGGVKNYFAKVSHFLQG